MINRAQSKKEMMMPKNRKRLRLRRDYDEHYTAKSAAAWLGDTCRDDAREGRDAAEREAEELERIADTASDVPPDLLAQFADALNQLGRSTHELRSTLLRSREPVVNAQQFVDRFINEARAANAAGIRARRESFGTIY